MLPSLPQTAQISEQKKREMWNNIQTKQENTYTKGTRGKRKGFVVGLASFVTLFLIGIIVLSELENTGNNNANVNQMLDVSKLEKDKGASNTIYTSYKPISLDLTKQIIPYPSKFPTYLPIEATNGETVKIRSWDPQGKKVSLEINYFKDDAGITHLITFESANFDNGYSVPEIDSEKLELKSGVSANFIINQNTRILEWEENKQFYKLSYTYLNNEQTHPSEELIEEHKNELIKIYKELK